MTIDVAIRDEILKRIAKGESLRSICEDDWMPSRESVRRWLDDDADFCAQYARARELQADHYADETLEIAASATPETVQVARLQIDTRKWMAGKLRPKVYGEKIALGGADDLPPVKHEVSAVDIIKARVNAAAERLGTTGETSDE